MEHYGVQIQFDKFWTLNKTENQYLKFFSDKIKVFFDQEYRPKMTDIQEMQLQTILNSIQIHLDCKKDANIKKTFFEKG